MSDERIAWSANTLPASEDRYLSAMTRETLAPVRAFHESMPGYASTPLVALEARANELGVGGLFVKDESARFGLNAFKSLGGSYAMARCVAQRVGIEADELTYARVTADGVRSACKDLTFFTATDGNHGRGVAWSAQWLGARAVVLMPKGTTEARRAAIEAYGAEVSIEDVNYDECVRRADAAAESCGGVLVQDTAWLGYEDIPTWIMQGYGTLIGEAVEQLAAASVARPTHVFVQAGVGSLSGAVTAYLANCYPDAMPKLVVVEASKAACLYKSAQAGDGKPCIVDGDLDTIMAGLACGQPSTIGWDILRNHVSVFASCPDWVTECGMRALGRPAGDDPRVVSGESGAVGMGLLQTVMTGGEYDDLRQQLELDETSQVLCISTEGDTDPERYAHIIGV